METNTKLYKGHPEKWVIIDNGKEIEVNMDDNYEDLLKLSEQTMKELWDNEEDEIWNKYSAR